MVMRDQAGQGEGECGFPRTRSAHDRHPAAGGDLQADPGQLQAGRAGVREAEPVSCDQGHDATSRAMRCHGR